MGPTGKIMLGVATGDEGVDAAARRQAEAGIDAFVDLPPA